MTPISVNIQCEVVDHVGLDQFAIVEGLMTVGGWVATRKRNTMEDWTRFSNTWENEQDIK